ncbi:hypothetical protein ACIOWG_10115 [Streptomyces sp. NPDC087658]|uniref:DUF7848 domain-containing protein n=2 Tax=unclassified Streptomyces TaxID=2593676 RepID=UPI0037F994D9
MITRRFRLMNWSLVPTDDEPDIPAPTYTFRCFTLDGNDKECGAASGPQTDPHAARKWARDHWESTDNYPGRLSA